MIKERDSGVDFVTERINPVLDGDARLLLGSTTDLGTVSDGANVLIAGARGLLGADLLDTSSVRNRERAPSRGVIALDNFASGVAHSTEEGFRRG